MCEVQNTKLKYFSCALTLRDYQVCPDIPCSAYIMMLYENKIIPRWVLMVIYAAI